jgi:hypothetical protein
LKTPNEECSPRENPSTTNANAAINQGVGEKRMTDNCLSSLTDGRKAHKQTAIITVKLAPRRVRVIVFFAWTPIPVVYP